MLKPIWNNISKVAPWCTGLHIHPTSKRSTFIPRRRYKPLWEYVEKGICCKKSAKSHMWSYLLRQSLVNKGTKELKIYFKVKHFLGDLWILLINCEYHTPWEYSYSKINVTGKLPAKRIIISLEWNDMGMGNLGFSHSQGKDFDKCHSSNVFAWKHVPWWHCLPLVEFHL